MVTQVHLCSYPSHQLVRHRCAQIALKEHLLVLMCLAPHMFPTVSWGLSEAHVPCVLPLTRTAACPRRACSRYMCVKPETGEAHL